MSTYNIVRHDSEAMIFCSSKQGLKSFYRLSTKKIICTIEFKSSTDSMKVKDCDTRCSLDTGIDYIPFNFVSSLNLKKGQFSNLSPFYVVFIDKKLAFKGRLFSGQFKNWVYEKTKDITFIGQEKDGFKSGFGHLKTPKFEYIGNFENNHFSGKGKRIVKNVEFKGNFVLSKLKDEVIRKENRENFLYYHSDGSEEEDFCYNPLPYFTKNLDVKESRKNGFEVTKKNGRNWLVLHSGSKTLLLDNVSLENLEIINSANSNSLNLTSMPGQAPEKKKIYFENGEIYTGNLVNNQFNGFGKYNYSNNLTYIGDFRNGQRHGIGTMFKYSQKIVKGQWVNNILHGKARVYENTNIINCLFIDGNICSVITISN